MSRVHVLAAHPRRTLGALAVALAAAGLTAGSGANFAATKANAANTFATGTLSIANTPGTAILTASSLRPGGGAQTGTVDIENTGSLSGAFTLGSSSPVDSTPSLLGALNLVVKDCGAWSAGVAPSCAGATQVYAGAADGLTSARALGTFAAADKHRYQFAVDLPSTVTDNALQGKTASIQFDWVATSL
jgi:hypothetical protein